MKWILQLWLNLWMPSFFGIGMGPSGDEKSQYGAVAGIANFGTSEGEGDILKSDDFFKSILSGDPSKIAKVLGPQMSTINKQGQQEKKTLSEFGNRGGGTNARAQSIDDTTRTSVDSLISSLTGNAASALGASGSGLLAAGLNAHETAFSEANTIQQQHAAKMNDLFKSIASVAAAPFTGGASLLAFTGGSGGGGGLSVPHFGGGDSGVTAGTGEGFD